MPVPPSARPQRFQPNAPLLPSWNLPLDKVRDFLGDQRKDNWCWAAVTALASKMLDLNEGQGFSQEEVVSRVDPTLADHPNTLLNSWPAVGIAAEQIPSGSLLDELSDIQLRVANGEPVGVHIDWISSPPIPGHELCAIGTGQIAGEPALAIYDPAKGGDMDNIVQLPVNGLFSYYTGDEAGLRGFWSAATTVA